MCGLRVLWMFMLRFNYWENYWQAFNSMCDVTRNRSAVLGDG